MASGDRISFNVLPPRVFLRTSNDYPPGTWNPPPRSYIFLCATIIMAHDGFCPGSNGTVLEVRPITYGGKPCLAYDYANGWQGRPIVGEKIAGGNITQDISRNEMVMVVQNAPGECQFFVGKKGGQGIQLQPVPWTSFHIVVPQGPPAHAITTGSKAIGTGH